MEIVAQKYCGAVPTQTKALRYRNWTYFQRQLELTGLKAPGQFDFISALEIIEHMTDTDAFIRDCRDHLKPNGFLIVSTPNINSLRNRVLVPLGAYPAGIEYRNIIHHVQLYNRKTLLTHFSEHGFDILLTRGVSFLPAKWLKYRAIKGIDNVLAKAFPSLCGNLIGIFRKRI